MKALLDLKISKLARLIFAVAALVAGQVIMKATGRCGSGWGWFCASSSSPSWAGARSTAAGKSENRLRAKRSDEKSALAGAFFAYLGLAGSRMGVGSKKYLLTRWGYFFMVRPSRLMRPWII